ncbi:mediator of RNA polymerase II transcription subunit 15 isoform X2 [Drosophila navojoa]|uniref:mediator of RNA polymerase II transcription subunit 15 isoform X2 n=1 Tax=Drosophila navojoa TaxID=7232 RepID=UPI00084671CE|nr:mediator of RNA polymerase II transcription subunit 15 isoform X2 [Drosophila navojoa]
MDQKRGNARQGASRTSVASRHAAGMPANAANVARKYGSEVSLTPSQARQNVENPRKSPLDALSRMNYRQDPFQRRSGLQDVDESFLASNAFARPSRLRHSGLEASNVPVAGTQQPAANAAVAPIRVASGQEPLQSQVQYQQQQPPLMQQPQQQQPPQAAPTPQQALGNIAPAQVQMQQQQQQPPAAVPQQPPLAVPAQQPQQSMPQQQNQQAPQYVQPPAAGQPTRHDPYPSGRAHVQHQQQPEVQQQQQQMVQQDAKGQGQAQAQAQMQQQQPMQQQQQQQPPPQMSPRKYQQPQQGYPSQAANAVPPAAEMCTTCPNCQTTIYLVRTPELGHGDAGMPMQ